MQLPILAVATGANALVCAWLVPRLGLMGAVWALLAYAVLYVGLSSVVFAQGLRGVEDSRTRGTIIPDLDRDRASSGEAHPEDKQAL